MKGPTDETVGERFRVDLLQEARDKTLAVIIEAAQAKRALRSKPMTYSFSISDRFLLAMKATSGVHLSSVTIQKKKNDAKMPR